MAEPDYRYKGARALVMLHEEQIRQFYEVWKEALKRNVKLPKTDDPDYESMQTLLVHVLRSSGGYMRWICRNLGLSDPEIEQVPAPEDIESEAENYMDHLLSKWRQPLAGVEEERFFNSVYKSNWGVDYCAEAMLEHAVMHPIRHAFQLKEL